TAHLSYHRGIVAGCSADSRGGPDTVFTEDGVRATRALRSDDSWSGVRTTPHAVEMEQHLHPCGDGYWPARRPERPRPGGRIPTLGCRRGRDTRPERGGGAFP